MIEPIRPDEVVSLKATQIPDQVIGVFNTLIAENWKGDRAAIKQDLVMERLESLAIPRHLAFANHWLDVEDVYRAAGWVVEYDKPGYNEDYDAFFVFSAGKKD